MSSAKVLAAAENSTRSPAFFDANSHYVFTFDGFAQTRIFSVYIDPNLGVDFELTSAEDKDDEQIVEELVENWPLSVLVELIHNEAVIPVAEIVGRDPVTIKEGSLPDFFLSVINYLDNYCHIRIENDEELAEFINLHCPA